MALYPNFNFNFSDVISIIRISSLGHTNERIYCHNANFGIPVSYYTNAINIKYYKWSRLVLQLLCVPTSSYQLTYNKDAYYFKYTITLARVSPSTTFCFSKTCLYRISAPLGDVMSVVLMMMVDKMAAGVGCDVRWWLTWWLCWWLSCNDGCEDGCDVCSVDDDGWQNGGWRRMRCAKMAVMMARDDGCAEGLLDGCSDG